MAYNYDALNRLEKVYEGADPSAAENEITRYGYDDVGNLQRVSCANCVTSVYGYTPLNLLESLTVSRLGSIGQPIMAYGYASLASGQRTAAEESYGFTAQTACTRSVRCTYDGYWRLKSESISTQPLNSSTPQLPSGTISYTHDNVGNRLTRTSTVAGVSNQVFTYDNNDRINGDAWDNNGNTLTASSSQPLNTSTPEPGVRGTDSYDSENHLTTRTGANGESVTILYDGDGNRVGETVAKDGITTTSTYLVDTLNPTGYAQVLEEQCNGAVTRVYLFGHDLIAQDTQTSSGTDATWSRLWYGYDGHGTTRFLTDDAGQVVEAYEYEAFGQLLKAWFPSAPQTSILGPQTHYLYCGEQFDSALGLYHLRARLMNPLTGRFWAMDSYEGYKGEPLSLHKHVYANGDPANCSDPSGNITLSEVSVTMLTSAILSGMVSVVVNRNLSGADFWCQVGQDAGIGGLTAPIGGALLQGVGRVIAPLARVVLAPLFQIIGELEPILLTGGKSGLQKLGVNISRFFFRTTQSYPSVTSTPIGKILKILFPNADWEMHHILIQQAWSKGVAPFFGDNPLANEGLRRVGNGLWNLIPIPRALNGAILANSGEATALFATAYYVTCAWGFYAAESMLHDQF